jgi:hypothetical protein
MSENTLLDLENMLEETLDAIPDMPDYVTPPAGEYVLEVKDSIIDKYTTKKEPDVEKQRLKNTYSIVETISTATKEEPVPDGSLFTETFMATTDGLGYYKKRICSIMGVTDTAGVSLSDMMNSVKGMQFNARLTIKKSKGADGTEYENVQIRVVPQK